MIIFSPALTASQVLPCCRFFVLCQPHSRPTCSQQLRIYRPNTEKTEILPTLRQPLARRSQSKIENQKLLTGVLPIYPLPDALLPVRKPCR